MTQIGMLLLPWIGMPVLSGLVAILLGQDANWDLRNYHFYNPYAFLNGRLGYDALAAQIASFYNPLLYVPFYYAVNWLPPKGTAFLLGFIQGLNFPLLLVIARRLLDRVREQDASAIAFLIAVAGVSGAGNVSELGTMFSDNLLSLPVLLSLLLIVSREERLLNASWAERVSILLAAGTLVGLAAGFKQPSAVYAVGLCLAFFTFDIPFAVRFVFAFIFGVGVLIGMAASSGFWLYEMWKRFHNPLFPYFNQFFRSPMALTGDYRDVRFLPQSIGEYLMKVFCFAIAPKKISEVSFQDWRLPVLYILSLAAGIRWLSNRSSAGLSQPSFNPLKDRHSMEPFLFSFLAVSYLAWLKLFAIFRYAMVIEMLAPLGIWLMIRKLDGSIGRRRILSLICIGVVFITTQPADWGRVRWGADYFGADLPQLEDPDHTLVLMTGTDAMSYLIPLFPPKVRFLRIQSFFNLYAEKSGYDAWMAQRIQEHHGPMFVLYRASGVQAAQDALASFGLQQNRKSCTRLMPRLEENEDAPLLFCTVTPAK
jgi:hypothetical protein